MDEAKVRQLLEEVRLGTLQADDAVLALRALPFVDLGFARVDHHRSLRQGLAEVVYGPNKTPNQCGAIVAELLQANSGPVLLTRANADQAAVALAQNPTGHQHKHGEDWNTVVWQSAIPRNNKVMVVAAGTADLPVADEAEVVLTAHGLAPIRISDVGVAGIHRILGEAEQLLTADAVVVVAGMEGALASVVGGLTPAPVIAVPTSVGYGSSLEGVTALLAMLCSCAAGVTVVGVDNGFGAACAVLRLLAPKSTLQQNQLV
ncbi:MAG: nickel pincer cofactor biosynthesis protein LarB [bacterium]|nr:nickel pincer cofactor biosynthesis protein LarB [bacterium]